jgi:hypothetical protein
VIFKEINGFEADLTLVDGKWVGKVTSVGPFWSNPARNRDGRLKIGLEIEFVRPGPSWILSDSNLPWFILDPDRGEIEHYR